MQTSLVVLLVTNVLLSNGPNEPGAVSRPVQAPKTPEHACFEQFTAGAKTEANRSTFGGIVLIRDIEYRQGASEKFKLDLAMPAAPAEQPRPAVALIHGGGWHAGDKDRPFVQGGALLFAKRGYVCINVNYRLSGEAPFPAAFEDVKCAVRWLRANAETYNVDPNRIGAVGVSAGGHLAALLGLAASAANLGSDSPHEGYSSQVQAVAAVCGPTDLKAVGHRRSASAFLAGPEETLAQRQKAASPITYVRKDAPAFLIVHGTADETVPVRQSEAFAKALKDAGAKDVTYMPVEGVGHPVDKHPRVREAIDAFFDRKLKQTPRE